MTRANWLPWLRCTVIACSDRTAPSRTSGTGIGAPPRPKTATSPPLAVVHDHAGVAVVETDVVVVRRHQQRLAGVAAVGARDRPGAPRRSSARPCALQCCTPRGPRRWAHSSRCWSSAASAAAASPASAASCMAAPLALDVRANAGELLRGQPGVVVDLDELDPEAARTEHVQRVLRAALLDGGGQLGDAARRREPAVGRQGGDPVAHQRRGGRRLLLDGGFRAVRRAAPRPCGGVRRPSVSRSTRSPSTAPASTDASWSGSPTSTSRVDGRSASSSRAIIVSDTIELSSTTTTSYRQPVGAVVAEPAARLGPPAQQPVQRRRRQVAQPRPVLRPGESAVDDRTASSSRAAAFPVGAASAMRQSGCCSRSSASSRLTVVVLPVPGPPASTLTRDSAQHVAASRWSSSARLGEQPLQPGGRARRGRGRRGATRTARAAQRATCSSWSQYLPSQSREPTIRSGPPTSGLAAQRATQSSGQCSGTSAAGASIVVVDVGARRRLGRREVEHDRPVPRRAHHERDREQHRLVVLAADGGEPPGDVHVGGRQDAGAVEVAEQPFRRAAPATRRKTAVTAIPPAGRTAR